MIDSKCLRPQKPPWIAFPQIAPTELVAYLKQGDTEAWFDQVWRPFWDALDATQRVAYLNEWKATPEWIDAINCVYDLPQAFDADADAQESAVYLQALRDEQRRLRSRSWLSRMFGN